MNTAPTEWPAGDVFDLPWLQDGPEEDDKHFIPDATSKESSRWWTKIGTFFFAFFEHLNEYS